MEYAQSSEVTESTSESEIRAIRQEVESIFSATHDALVDEANEREARTRAQLSTAAFTHKLAVQQRVEKHLFLNEEMYTVPHYERDELEAYCRKAILDTGRYMSSVRESVAVDGSHEGYQD